MGVLSALLLALLVVAVSGGPTSVPVSSSCSYWCKATGGTGFYCCDHEQVHAGSCPPLRPTCVRRLHTFKPPVSCTGDFICGNADKCCYDVCLKQKVCKPAQ